MNNCTSRTWKIAILLSVFLISLSGLLLQLTLTRIFSVTLFYHYAFVAVSVALFGWGLGGIVLHLTKQRFQTVKTRFVLSAISLYSVSMPFYLLIVKQFHFSMNQIIFYYGVSLIPFFLAGLSLAFFYSEYARLAGKLYVADLAGAGVACLLVEPILNVLGAESTILLLGVITSLDGLLIVALLRRRKAIVFSLVILALTSSFVVANHQLGVFVVSDSGEKAMFQLLQGNPFLRIGFTSWNSFSRVDCVEGFQDPLQAIIYIDAGASTDICKWDGKIESLEYLKNTVGYLPYCLVKNPKTLNIGSGGGKDVLIALAGNSSEITAVELNPLVIEAVEKYRQQTTDVYDTARVELHVDEGRSYIHRSNESFDVITLTLVDSWAAVSSGGYALAENYLYTKEAFIDYINHLNDDGLLVLVRWNFEVARLVSTATEAMTTLGEDILNVGKHIAVVMFEAGSGSVGALFVLKKTPFTQAEAQLFKNRTLAMGQSFSPFYIPYVKEENEPYHSLFNGNLSVQQYINWFSYRVNAVTDDSPYFFNTEKMIPKALNDLMIVGSCFVLFTIAVPCALYFKRRRSRSLEEPSTLVKGNSHRFGLHYFAIFFAALGIGYMLVEVATIQKFILFLGYPTRALTVTLFSLLLSSGIGSLVNEHFTSNRKTITRNIILACLLIISTISIYVLTLPRLLEYFLPLSSMARIAITILLIFPLGLLMGIPFPSGIRVLNEFSSENIPWIWGINGSMSVLGSVSATISSIIFGFSYAILFGMAAYSVALIIVVLWTKRAQGGQTASGVSPSNYYRVSSARARQRTTIKKRKRYFGVCH